MAHTNRRVPAPSPESRPIPDRLYYRIGEVASLCGVAPSVLRFWETQFPQLRPTKGGTGQRLYRRRELDLALRIHQLVHVQGYTLAGARQALSQPNAALPQPASTLPQPVATSPESASHSSGSESTLPVALHPVLSQSAPAMPAPAIAPVASVQSLAALRATLTELREMLTRNAATPAHAAAAPAPEPRRRPRLAPLGPSLFADFDA